MRQGLDFSNIQGDILNHGLPKKAESFFFFNIKEDQVAAFQAQLQDFIPMITTVEKCQEGRKAIKSEKELASTEQRKPKLIEIAGINIAFSQKGLNKLDITEDINDATFKQGMKRGAEDVLNDDLRNWDKRFQGDIDGVFLVTGHGLDKVNETIDLIKESFGVGVDNDDATITNVTILLGHSRPGKMGGREHFGFQDGISQPAIEGVGKEPLPGQQEIKQGVILLGRDGDDQKRPSWARDGSFLCFRYLRQLVPEFKKFLEDNAPKDIPRQRPSGDPSGADLLGARLVGRWPSGAPLVLTPLRDDPQFAVKTENDNFTTHDIPGGNGQELCPFAAHTRKMNPRGDIPLEFINKSRIIRRGIAFGPEVTAEEAASHTSSDKPELERGLHFVCYQSNLDAGFVTLQQAWANDISFPPNQKHEKAGYDPLIGQARKGSQRQMSGANREATDVQLSLTREWVVSRGGEYFFTPSILALKERFSKY